MNAEKLNIEKAIAVLVVVGALLFVAYGEFSNTLSGAIVYPNSNYRNCQDTDPKNLPTIQGTLTAKRLNVQTNEYSPITPILDYCVPEGGNQVQEWSCSLRGNKPMEVERATYCPKGTVCRAGVCV